MILRALHMKLAAWLILLAVCAVAADTSAKSSPIVRAGKKPAYEAHPATDLVCRIFGECEPCPEDDLDQPFCKPFGNRRLLHCVPAGSGDDADELPAWEACGKVIKREQRDFYEFVTANVLLLIVCLAIFAVRTSTLAAQQYRQLAARIGIPSGPWEV